MQDRPLAARRASGIAFVDGEEHGRARAKVKRHKLTDKATTAAIHPNLRHTALLDMSVADYR
jgi:hypothetical protein